MPYRSEPRALPRSPSPSAVQVPGEHDRIALVHELQCLGGRIEFQVQKLLNQPRHILASKRSDRRSKMEIRFEFHVRPGSQGFNEPTCSVLAANESIRNVDPPSRKGSVKRPQPFTD